MMLKKHAVKDTPKPLRSIDQDGHKIIGWGYWTTTDKPELECDYCGEVTLGFGGSAYLTRDFYTIPCRKCEIELRLESEAARTPF
jgi:hypothetical protein